MGGSEVRKELRHNPENGVTGGIWRVRRADGTAAVRKVLLPPGAAVTAAHWQASGDPASVRVASEEQRDSGGGRTPEPREKFRQRALGLAHLCRWADEARGLASSLLPGM